MVFDGLRSKRTFIIRGGEEGRHLDACWCVQTMTGARRCRGRFSFRREHADRLPFQPVRSFGCGVGSSSGNNLLRAALFASCRALDLRAALGNTCKRLPRVLGCIAFLVHFRHRTAVGSGSSRVRSTPYKRLLIIRALSRTMPARSCRTRFVATTSLDSFSGPYSSGLLPPPSLPPLSEAIMHTTVSMTRGGRTGTRR